MTTTSPVPFRTPGPTLPAAGRASSGQAPTGTASVKWAALQDAAIAVAALAGLDAERAGAEMRGIPATLHDADATRRAMAERWIEDLAGVMEPGLAALIAVRAKGADATAPALALWREFDAARTAIFSLVPSGANRSPYRAS